MTIASTIPRKSLVARVADLNSIGGTVPESLVLLSARVFPAMVYWQSARTKVEGFTISEKTYFLFEHVYALPIIPFRLAAQLATVAEHVLPVLLVLGIMSRVSALGLLVMTLVIQIFVFPGAWVVHGLWAASLLIVISRGPGLIALDPWLGLERKPG